MFCLVCGRELVSNRENVSRPKVLEEIRPENTNFTGRGSLTDRGVDIGLDWKIILK